MAFLYFETPYRHGTGVVHSIKDRVFIESGPIDFGLGIEGPKVFINMDDLFQTNPYILSNVFSCYLRIWPDAYISRDGYGELFDVYASGGHELMEGLGQLIDGLGLDLAS